MDFNQNNQNFHDYQAQGPYQFERPPYPERNAMSTAAAVLGVLTILSAIMCTVYVPFITGGLAILFAILSRGKEKHMNGTATIGTATGLVGLLINIALIVSVWYLYSTVPEIHDRANDLFEQRYGYTIDEMLDEISQ